MIKLAPALAIALFLFSSFTPPFEKHRVGSDLKSATVYRTGAELLHNAVARLEAGDNELEIEGISSYLDINSIQVNCPAAVTILGIEFNNNYLGEENISPTVRLFKDSLENIHNSLQQTNILINTSTELLEVLRINREIKGSQTGLSVAELSRLMNYYKDKSIEVQKDLATYRARKTRLEALSSKLTNQVAEEQKKNTRSGGRLLLQLSVAVAGNHDFTISYITPNAYWTPYYDIRADNIKSPLSFIYKARIAQTTGIDWKKVRLSLSTASPKQFGNAPILKTWFLSYIDPVNVMNRAVASSNSINSAIAGKVAGVQIEEVTTSNYKVRLRGSNVTNGSEPLFVVNGNIMSASDYSRINPDKVKDIQMLTGADATAIYGARGINGVAVISLKEGLEDYVTVSDSELDLTYDIALPYDIPTNGKQQVATLKETNVPATYKYYVVPKLDKDAFLLAEIANWQVLNLLPGEANIIFEGRYIGKSFIDPSNTNDTLNLTLGTDKRVVVKKEKMVDYSSVKFLGSNKLQTITYEITIKNNKKEPIHIILKDPYPVSTNKDIEVELLESSNGRNNTEIGVVTWQLNIEPGKHEKRRISYSVKYPRGKQVNLN